MKTRKLNRHLSVIVLLLASCLMQAQLFEQAIQINISTDDVVDISHADIDGDGDIDAVSICDDSNSTGLMYIIWYENDGTGFFIKEHVIEEGLFDFRKVICEDWDADGDTDIIVSNYSSDDFILYQNINNTGVFSNVNINSSANGAYDIVSVDIDDDGDLDVISSSVLQGYIRWHINNNGNLSSGSVISNTASGAYSLSSGDLNGDGYKDVIYSSLSSDLVAWLPNDGAGDFGAAQMVSDTFENPETIVSGDMDSDGDIDVAAVSPSQGVLKWFENDGTGLFIEEHLIYDNVAEAEDLIAGDFDEDGDIDLMFCRENPSGSKVFYNFGNGVFTYTHISYSMRCLDFGGDLDGDGIADIISNYNIGNIIWHKNSNNGSPIKFGGRVNQPMANSSYYSSIDYDNDGDEDLLLNSKLDLRLYVQDGNILNSTPQLLDQIEFYSTAINSVYVVDFDQDGNDDVIVNKNNDLSWVQNLGAGTLAPSQSINGDANNMSRYAFDDFDGDGLIDIIGSRNTNTPGLEWYQNLGAGTISDPTTLMEAPLHFGLIEMTDVDGDGDNDLLGSSYYGNDKIFWLERQGMSLNAQHIITSGVESPTSAKAVDMDQDGDKDIVVCDNINDKVLWFANDGSGDFGDQIIIDCDVSRPRIPHVADLDHDGDQDLVVASSDYNTITSLYTNTGGEAFERSTIFSGNPSQRLFLFDYDDDTDLDIYSISIGRNVQRLLESNAGIGCTDNLACNFDPNAYIDSGCCYTNCGCPDPLAENFSATATCDDGSCIYIEGCTSTTATNFDPNATLNDGSCLYTSACTDPNAANFNPDAICGDGSCKYKIDITVFHDINQNGTREPGEPGLPFQLVNENIQGTSHITNGEGVFTHGVESFWNLSYQMPQNPIFPFFTTPSTVSLDAFDAWPSEIFFGVSFDAPEYDLLVDLNTLGDGYPCDMPHLHQIYVRNLGNITLDIVSELTMDELFLGAVAIDPIDSIADNRIYHSFTGLEPGHWIIFEVDLQTPSADNIGAILSSIAQVTGFYQEEPVAYGEDQLELELTCAYDPNDKQVWPQGYTEEHYVAADTLLEYLVRFQNTGNAPATDVIVRDTLDIHLDPSTLTVISNSHSMSTLIDHESGALAFNFNMINLPDSVSSPDESHGFISYSVRPFTDTPLLTRIENTAGIYFDTNDPIITNTTWSTLYDCSLFTVELNQNVNLLTATEGDDYLWYLDGELIDGANEQTHEAQASGSYEVLVNTDFPCSGTSESVILILGIDDWVDKKRFVAYPNPMTTHTSIQLLDMHGEVDYAIVDGAGRVIMSKHQADASLPIIVMRQGLSAGLYRVNIVTDEGSINVPIVVGK